MHEQSVVKSIIGGHMGPSAEREGVTEAARRLSHAMAEIAAVLDSVQYLVEDDVVAQVSQKANGTLKEWGVL